MRPPLADLPPVQPVPAQSNHSGTGNLPFGPPTVEMYADTEGPVIVRPVRFGYAFWDVGFERSPPIAAPALDWTVFAQLWTLDSNGAPAEAVAHRKVHIGRINDAYQPSLNVQVPDDIGFYRYDIQIVDDEGEALGTYSQYLRVVPEMVKVRLGINRRHFRPGQTVATRPEDLGTNWLTFGETFGVQRRDGGSWHRYPPLNRNYWDAWLGTVGLGGAGSCSRFTIPADTPPGRYRVTKSVGVLLPRDKTLPLTMTAPFTVTHR
jgi:hypothetical protein